MQKSVQWQDRSAEVRQVFAFFSSFSKGLCIFHRKDEGCCSPCLAEHIRASTALTGLMSLCRPMLHGRCRKSVRTGTFSLRRLLLCHGFGIARTVGTFLSKRLLLSRILGNPEFERLSKFVN